VGHSLVINRSMRLLVHEDAHSWYVRLAEVQLPVHGYLHISEGHAAESHVPHRPVLHPLTLRDADAIKICNAIYIIRLSRILIKTLTKIHLSRP
jgi:hypothetical protein